MKTVGTKKQGSKENKTKDLRIRVTPSEHLLMTARAGQFFKGNLSDLIRFAVDHIRVSDMKRAGIYRPGKKKTGRTPKARPVKIIQL